MTSEQKRLATQLHALSLLCVHIEEEYNITSQDCFKICEGWILDPITGLPVVPTPHETFIMLTAVARAIKFEIVVRPPKIIM